MASQPGTPFIPPLHTANNSPISSPVAVVSGSGEDTGTSNPTYSATDEGGSVPHHMDMFTPGANYYPVLDPFIVKVVQARIFINPLIATIPGEGSNHPGLNWNMLFPTSTVHRSGTSKHMSWSIGRDAPATFPRVSSMRLVVEFYPWIIEVRSKDEDYGVTCDEVIEAIRYDLGRIAHQQEFNNLTRHERDDLSAAYWMNREDDALDGALGKGLKRLDFLRRNTIFGGVEVNDRAVVDKCGDVLPCVFVLHCFPM